MPDARADEPSGRGTPTISRPGPGRAADATGHTFRLNKGEAARLEKGQEHVQKLEDKALADGKVTAAEKARIERSQDVQSRRIARQKHDRQKAKPN